MEGYATEEQQVEALKAWWKSYGNTVIIGIIVVLASIVGVRYYNDSKTEAQEQVSKAYEAVIAELSEKGLDSQQATQAFIDANSDSAYASLTALNLATLAVNKQDYAEAEKQLAWVAAHGEHDGVVSLANLRLARVQAEQQKYDAALASLAKIKAETFAGKVAEVKGDIYLLQGKSTDARTAYESALLASGANRQLLQLKLDDLAVAADVTDDLEAEIAGELDAK